MSSAIECAECGRGGECGARLDIYDIARPTLTPDELDGSFRPPPFKYFIRVASLQKSLSSSHSVLVISEYLRISF